MVHEEQSFPMGIGTYGCMGSGPSEYSPPWKTGGAIPRNPDCLIKGEGQDYAHVGGAFAEVGRD